MSQQIMSSGAISLLSQVLHVLVEALRFGNTVLNYRPTHMGSRYTQTTPEELYKSSKMYSNFAIQGSTTGYYFSRATAR